MAPRRRTRDTLTTRASEGINIDAWGTVRSFRESTRPHLVVGESFYPLESLALRIVLRASQRAFLVDIVLFRRIPSGVGANYTYSCSWARLDVGRGVLASSRGARAPKPQGCRFPRRDAKCAALPLIDHRLVH